MTPARRKKRRRARRRRDAETMSTVELIDRQLTRMVPIKDSHEKVMAIKRIMSELYRRDMEGDSQAGYVLSKYEDLANQLAERPLVITFVDDAYTRSSTDTGVADG